jgi:cytochrome c peroxidase
VKLTVAWGAAAVACAVLGGPGSGQPPLPAQDSGSDGFDLKALARIRTPPLGLPPVPIPADNPATRAKLRLGRKLFLDRRLSHNGTLSCAMCHVPEQAFTSNELRTAVGNEGKTLGRSAPSLLNVAYAGPFFHDGREPDLDLQAFDVLLNPDEMAAASLGALLSRLRSLADYAPLFQQAFRAPPGVASIGQALGAYLRSLLSADSPFDRWRFGGAAGALGASAQRGYGLFTGRAGCAACHEVGAAHAVFSDHGFHDTGIGWRAAMLEGAAREPVRVELAPGVFTLLEPAVVRSVGRPLPSDPGRFRVTGDPSDRWRFKTPSLRNVALTAPYMHDGSISSLPEVVAFYDRGGVPHEGLDPRVEPLGLARDEVQDLVAFLESLTGSNLAELVADARSERVGNRE